LQSGHAWFPMHRCHCCLTLDTSQTMIQASSLKLRVSCSTCTRTPITLIVICCITAMTHCVCACYLSEHCIPVSSADTRRHLRSANRHLLAVPRFPLNIYGRRAFSVAGLMAWNCLPDFIRDPTSSTDCFRRLLRTYLFMRY